jgi:two-component system KDP operon response regulator KdpE
LSLSPIIVLSAIGSEKTKIDALDMGADDYLVLPFGMEEFLARVRASIRRWGLMNPVDRPGSSILPSCD